MLALLGRLFGSPKAIDSVIDGVTNGLDKLVYTDEEKAEDAKKERSEARSMIVSWMSATSGQNLARRLIALMITASWLGLYLSSAVADIAAVWLHAVGEKLTLTGEILAGRAADMNPAVMLILAFYFAAPHMGDIAKAAVNRFSNTATNAPADRVG